MEGVIYPELKYRMLIWCSNGSLVEKLLVIVSQYSHWYDAINATEEGMTFETKEFTNLMCVISFYKSAISVVDNVPFDDVDEDKYLNGISLEVDYVSEYWAGRLFQELTTAITLCGASCTLTSPRISGTTTSVVCRSWDALLNLDKLIMKAGHGYSKDPNCQAGYAARDSEVNSSIKPLLVFGIGMVAVVILLICVA